MPRRAVLFGGTGLLCAGIGLGYLFGQSRQRALTASATPAHATGTAEALTHTAGDQPPPLAMEEYPLPGDVASPAAPLATPSPVPAVADPGTEEAVAAAPPAVAPPPSHHIVETTPNWLRNAQPFVVAHGRPVVAVVIDDLGLDRARTERALALDPAVTMAFMTYAEKLPQWLARSRAAQHELLVHVPMQPESAAVDPGPNTLTVSLPQEEMLRRLRWGLDRLDGYVGANNHMGSRFTGDAAGMRVVLAELETRGLLFLDSLTTPRSTCGALARSLGLPFASRNVFLDNEATVPGVRRQIATLETVARSHGYAIGIGHPHDATLAALAEWLPQAQARGITVVPLTSAIRLTAEHT